ncbi:MAG: hypothetical protein H5U22_01775 [Rhizobium sp.]|nr:hypothetical protein [Rhizobium sp.]
MIYMAALFGVIAAFFAYISFKDARWVGDEEGPSVWEYAFPGILMCGLSAFTAICFLVASI